MDLRRRNPREQGDIGERAAVTWLWRAGAYVFVPFGHSPDCDVIAVFAEHLVRVEAKTSTVLARNSRRRYQVQIATGGGNQSWNRVVKRFEPQRCDFVFVLVSDGRRWFIPSQAISSEKAIVVGGQKYSEFEVRDEDAPESARRLLEWFGPPGECPSGQRERAVNASAQPTQVRILPPPSSAAQPTREPERRPRTRSGVTRVWGKRRITLPESAAQEAGIRIGDRLRTHSDGDGRLILVRIDQGGIQRARGSP